MSSALDAPNSNAPVRPVSRSQSDITPNPQQKRQPESSLATPDGQGSTPPVPRKRRLAHVLTEDSAKRRRQDGGFMATEELLKPSFVVRAHPPNPLQKPCTLLPLMLLPREHLPLASLDLQAPHGNDLPSARQFQSHIRILELEGRLGSNLLVARSHGGSSMFAIERDGPGLYAVCRLGNWVDIKKLSQQATALCQERMPAPPPMTTESILEPALVTPNVHKEQRKKRLAIAELQSIVRRKPVSQLASTEQSTFTGTPETTQLADGAEAPPVPVETQPQPKHETPSQPQTQSQLPTPPDTKPNPSPSQAERSDQAGPPTADGIFQNIRNQYFEALYHSMGSLAYFAKGPLSRARAAFHLDCDSNLEMDDLVDFLKGLVLATAVIDKKYRETVPEIVSRIRTFGDAADHAAAAEQPKRKSKKPKKIKMGSNGLYSDEDTHVGKWWHANKPDIRDDEVGPRPEEIKYTISCLRTRETQLQMILILEILALETTRPVNDNAESQLPGMLANTPPKPAPPPKKRSKHNFPLLIDVHADRLCIWESTTSDDVRALAESQTRGVGEQKSQATNSDPLKDFCVDIIVPFFTARLPLICDGLNRKLGGPVIAPPPRPKLSRSASSASHSSRDKSKQDRSKPGAAARRPAPGNSARSLERVLSNERLRRSVSRGPNDAIAQMRSATAAPIPGLKREISEPIALSSIPTASSSHRRQGSSSTLGSLKERPTSVLARSTSDTTGQIGQTPSHTDDRARRKALVDAELQEAILALKKPNREKAGKAVVEAAERRLFGAPGPIRRPKKSRPAGDRIQVKATPVTNRFRDVFSGESQTGGGGTGDGSQLAFIREPLFASALAAAAPIEKKSLSASSYNIAATPVAPRVQGTPVRSSASAVPDSAVRGTLFGSLAGSRGPSSAEKMLASSPVVRRQQQKQQPITIQAVTATPAKHSLLKVSRVTNDVVLASSPLQARVLDQDELAGAGPSVMARLPPSPLGIRKLFQTPTKTRPSAPLAMTATAVAASPGMEDGEAASLSKSPVSRPTMGRMQSLYEKMGWDDDIDDLA